MSKKLYTIQTKRENTLYKGILREKVLDLLASGGRVEYDATDNFYYIEPQFITDDELAGLGQVPDTTIWRFEREPDGLISGFYVKVTKLSNKLNKSLPFSSITEEVKGKEVTRQLTYQEVSEMPTASFLERDGVFYFDAMSQAGYRSMTYEEYNAITISLIWKDDLPPAPIEEDEEGGEDEV